MEKILRTSGKSDLPGANPYDKVRPTFADYLNQ